MLRDKRTQGTNMAVESEIVEELVQQSSQNCDFCPENYLRCTLPDDGNGRMETKHAYTCNNAFQIGRHHYMAMFRTHHPLIWTNEEYLDVCYTALAKLRQVFDREPGDHYGVLLWDQFNRSGSSQMHPHLHVIMAENGSMGEFDQAYHVSKQYNKMHKDADYFRDILYIHKRLGLAVEKGTAGCFASLTPKKDNDIVVIGSEANEDFFQLLFAAVRAYLDCLSVYCFSAAVSIPLNMECHNTQVPVIARIVSRGSLQETRSDISSLELFTTANVNIDPYKTIQAVKETVAKHFGGR